MSDRIHQSALEEMEKAGAEEKELALRAGCVDKNGIPMCTVVADEVWSKRSYKTMYDTMSDVISTYIYIYIKIVHLKSNFLKNININQVLALFFIINLYLTIIYNNINLIKNN